MAGAGGVTYRHWRWAGAAYVDPRGSAQIAAGGVSPGVADLAYIDLSHVEPGNTSGQLDIKYSSARTYSGQIEIRTTGAVVHDILVPNVDTTTWRLTGIDAATIAILLAGELIVSEPGHGDSTETHFWRLIANTVSQRADAGGL